MVSCSSRPDGEPEEVIREYYSLIDGADYEPAYDLLSDRNKENVDLEKFTKWNQLLASIYKEYEYEYELIEELEDENIDKLEAENIVKFKVNKKFLDIYSDKNESEYNDIYLYNYSLTSALIGANRYDEAMESANKFLGQIEEDNDENKDMLSNTYNLIGVIYLEQFEDDLVKQNFEKAI